MGNTSSQIVGPEQSQPQSSNTEAPTAPQALEIPAETLDKSAREEAVAFTPPPTGVLKETDSDSGQSHSSVDRDEVEIEEIDDIGSDEAAGQDTLNDTGSPELGDFSFMAVQHPREIDSHEIPQFDGTMDPPPSATANEAPIPSESPEAVQLSPAEEARRAKAERKRVRAEKRARKISRQLQRAMGSTPQARPTIETGLGAPFVEDETLVPETQPETVPKQPESLPAKLQEADAEVHNEETTPRAAEQQNGAAVSEEDVDMSYDFDDPGTQLRMEAERAQRARTSTTQELSSPLKRKEQELAQQKNNSKKRKAASVDFEEDAAKSPSQQRLSKKQAISRKAASSSEKTNTPQARNTPAKATSKKAKRQKTLPTEVQETQAIEDDKDVDVARSPESSPSQVPASSKPILTLSTDPPPGAAGSAKPKKKRVGKSTVQKDKDESDATPRRPTISGPFSQEEVNKVQEAVASYCDQNNISEQGFKEMLQPKNSSRTLVADVFTWIQDALPDRSRKSIRQFCQRRYSAAHRGPWTPDEDKDLREAYEEKPGNWVYIAELLGRLAEDCRDRWRDYVGNPSKQDGVWTDAEEAELEKAVVECVSRMRKERFNQELGDDFDDSILEANVNWAVVSDMLGKKRSRLQCRYKWAKLHYRKVRIAETGTPHPRRRKSGGLTSTPGNTDATPATGNKRKASKSSASKKPKATKEAGDKSIRPSSSAKPKKSRSVSAPHSSKKYLSAAKITPEDDDIEDETQPEQQQHNDDMEIYDIPQSPTTAQPRKSIRKATPLAHGSSARKPAPALQQVVATTNELEQSGQSGDPDTNELRPGGSRPAASRIEHEAGLNDAPAQIAAEPSSPSFASSPPILQPAVQTNQPSSEDSPQPIRRRAPLMYDSSPRPPSPITSGPSRLRARTPPDEKVWLPGDQYLMLHDLMAAYHAGNFTDLISFLATVRRECSEQHYTAEDRITQYWNIVKEAGFRGGLRRNIIASIDWLSDRYETWVLARTSHGNVVYDQSLERVPDQATPPRSRSQELLADERYQEVVVQRQAAQIREARGQILGSSVDPNQELSDRDQVIDQECEVEKGSRQRTDAEFAAEAALERRRAARRVAHESRHAERRARMTASEIDASEIRRRYNLDSQWHQWHLEAVVRKRTERVMEHGGDVEHPGPFAEFARMGEEELAFHLLKWRNKQRAPAIRVPDHILWDLARETTRVRAERRQEARREERKKIRREQGIELASTDEERERRSIPLAQQKHTADRIDRWSQEVIETMESGNLERVPDNEGIAAGSEVIEPISANDIAAEDTTHPTLHDYANMLAEQTIDQEAIVSDADAAQDAVNAPDHMTAQEHDLANDEGEEDEDVASGASEELGSLRLASPELGDLVDQPNRATQDTWQSSLPQEFKTLSRTPIPSSSRNRIKTYSKSDKRKSGIAEPSAGRKTEANEHEGHSTAEGSAMGESDGGNAIAA